MSILTIAYWDWFDHDHSMVTFLLVNEEPELFDLRNLHLLSHPKKERRIVEVNDQNIDDLFSDLEKEEDKSFPKYSISFLGFMRNIGLTLQKASKLLPKAHIGYYKASEKIFVLPSEMTKEDYHSNDFGEYEAFIPPEVEAVQPLADFLNIPIIVYDFSLRTKKIPEKLFMVYPQKN